MSNLFWFVIAAACEIAGCYTAWMWLRMERSAWWLVPGGISLLMFAFILTRIDSVFAGRAYAAYGGVYIVSSLVWLALIERSLPRTTDVIGSVLCLAGAAILLYGPRWNGA
jgi:small multidrug resistance family-3 protein